MFMGLASKLNAIAATTQQQTQYQPTPLIPTTNLNPFHVSPSAPPLLTDTQPIPQFHSPPSSSPFPQQIPQNPKPSLLASHLPKVVTGLFNSQGKTTLDTSPGPFYQPLKNRIDATIVNKNLHTFFPSNSPQYNNVLNRLSHIDFSAIASKRSLPLELSFDLASLGLFDIVVFIDDSGSINFDENWKPSTEKIDDINLILARITDIGGQFDDNGISICYFNNEKTFDNIRVFSLFTWDNPK
jgi:hypothetical protein